MWPSFGRQRVQPLCQPHWIYLEHHTRGSYLALIYVPLNFEYKLNLCMQKQRISFSIFSFFFSNKERSIQEHYFECSHQCYGLVTGRCLTRTLSTLLPKERYPNIPTHGLCEPQDCKSAQHPITHSLSPSTIDQTVINSHLSPTHCFPSCSMGLPPVPALHSWELLYIQSVQQLDLL